MMDVKNRYFDSFIPKSDAVQFIGRYYQGF